ncbi:MAG TPA: Hsp20/alpha crystallin family protein [Deltaproteobacteria bacterium]|nr:Hsp20/alpha crystallin family protein [Deltaproteobacteria bacterium]HQI82019.1 Hsp20/alpha crystallin family protein [Deltaproteobacteria bacterium]
MADTTKNLEKAPAQETALAERTKDRPVFMPPVDIIEDANNLYIYADMPGADEKGVNITLENDVLSIEAQVAEVNFDKHTTTYAEYGIGDYRRAFTLNESFDRDKIEAKMKNGVLSIVLPKSEAVRTRSIPIKAG